MDKHRFLKMPDDLRETHLDAEAAVITEETVFISFSSDEIADKAMQVAKDNHELMELRDQAKMEAKEWKGKIDEVKHRIQRNSKAIHVGGNDVRTQVFHVATEEGFFERYAESGHYVGERRMSPDEKKEHGVQTQLFVNSLKTGTNE